MARQHSGRRAGRFDDASSGGWLDERGVSEVIGSILVFGLLVSLLAIVQTQAVPNANQEVEVTHSNDVQGDMANLQAALTRSAIFGGTESTTVETGMTYPPRLVLYNPPSVQGTLRTEDGPIAPNAQVRNFTASNPDTAAYIVTDPTYNTSLMSYRANYNRYQESPTVRYEHTALVNDYGENATVEARGSLVNGNRINFLLLRDDLQESRVRPATVTTYPVSAPAQSVDIRTANLTGELVVPTNIDERVWVTELLDDQIDTNALQGTNVSDCDSLNGGGSNATTNPDTDDGRYVVACDYTTVSDSPNLLTLSLQTNSSYDLRTAKIGFNARSDRLDATYITEVPNANPGSFTVEVRDRYNNPIDRAVDVTVLTTRGQRNLTTDTSGRLTVDDVTGPANVYLTTGPFNYSVGSGPSCAASPGCAIAQGSSPLSRSSVSVVDVGADSANGELIYNFTNDKDSNATVEQVQLDYATQREERTFTVSGGSLEDALSGDLDGSTFSASLVSDGPNSIEEVTVDSATYEPVSPSGTPSGAKENLAPATFREDGSADGERVKLAPNSGTDVTFVLDDSFSLEEEDSVDVAITLYYEDGSQATYTRTLFNDAGEEGQSP